MVFIFFNDFSEKSFYNKLNNIRKAVSEISVNDISSLKNTISIGGYSKPGIVEDNLSYADEAMYEAKKIKNKVVIK